MRLGCIYTLLWSHLSLLHSYYCPFQHRHLGRNILLLHEGEGAPPLISHPEKQEQEEEAILLPKPSYWSAELVSRFLKFQYLVFPKMPPKNIS